MNQTGFGDVGIIFAEHENWNADSQPINNEVLTDLWT